MTQYLTGMWASNPAISAQPAFGWFNLTLPGGYVTGTGFTVVFVGGAQFDSPGEPASWIVEIQAVAGQAAAGTFPTPATTGLGAINAGPFDGNIPEISFAPGTTLLVYADDIWYAETSVPGMAQTFAAIAIPGANRTGIPGSAPTRQGGVVLGDAADDLSLGLPNGTGVTFFGAMNTPPPPQYAGEGPIGYAVPGEALGSDGPSTEFGFPLSPIPASAHSYAAGDTVSVGVRLTAANTAGDNKALRALIKSITVHVAATTISVPITSLYVGFGTHAASGTTTMRAVNSSYISPGFPSGSLHHTDLFLVDIIPAVLPTSQGYIF